MPQRGDIVWVVTEDSCCDKFIEVFATERGAKEYIDRENAQYLEQFGRIKYYYEEVSIEG